MNKYGGYSEDWLYVYACVAIFEYFLLPRIFAEPGVQQGGRPGYF